MSRRKAPKGLLGPDGRPLDRAKYAAKPATAVGFDAAGGKDATVMLTTADAGHIIPRSFMSAIVAGSFHLSMGKSAGPKPKPLAERVAADVEALTADLDFAGGAELPQPAPDLTAYADALDVAIRSCPHQDVADTIHSRGEYQCQDCGRYLSREDMRKRAAANPFGWYFR